MGVQIWDKDKIIAEAKSLIEMNGRLPGAKTLQKLHRADFLMAVRRHYPGNMSQLRINLKAPSGQKPSGFWSKEKLIEETKKLILLEGKIPSEKRISELGLNTINKYSQKYFGGLHGLAIACGINENHLFTKSGYWKDFDNVKKEVEEVVNEIGRFPTSTDLRLLNKHRLLSAISSNYDGLKSVRKFLGYTKKVPIAKDGHFCDSYSEVIIDDFLYMNKIPHKRNIQFNFPKIKCRPDFVLDNMIIIEVLMADYRIGNHKGRYKQYVDRYVKKRAAYKSAKMEMIEVFPDELIDRSKLEKKLYAIASKAEAPRPFLLKDFTNIIFFDKKSPGYWANPDNLKKELLPLIKQYGKIPSINILREIGRNDIEGAIISIYGSYRAVAKDIGVDYNNYQKPQRFWQDIKNIEEELKPVIEKYGYIPAKSELKKIGKEGVVVAVETYHRSFKNISALLGVDYKPNKKTNRHWLNEINIKNELEILVNKLGKFPSADDLRKQKLHGLLKGILNTYGSFRNAAIEQGFNVPENKPKGYWKSLSNVLTELALFVGNNVNIPSCKIIEKKKPILMYAIRNYHGGMQNIKNEYWKKYNN
jgi:hypothetical protein